MGCNSAMLFGAMLLGAYLLGSVAAAIVVCRVLGVGDPRTAGSGNPGATNVLRLAGKGAAAVTLVADAGKGTVAVLVGAALGLHGWQLTAVGLAAFSGHLFPIFHGFRGGKGVATLLGVIVALDPWLAFGFALVWLAIAASTRYSSLAALCATALVPVLAAWRGAGATATALFVVMAALVYWRHRRNIAQLIAGTEKRLGQKA